MSDAHGERGHESSLVNVLDIQQSYRDWILSIMQVRLLRFGTRGLSVVLLGWVFLALLSAFFAEPYCVLHPP